LAVRITVGSQEEAERIIAAIWVVLERTNIPSPQVRIPRSVPPPVAIELIFEKQVHEDFVSRDVPGLVPSNSAASSAHFGTAIPDREKRLRDKAEELRTAAEGLTAIARASFIRMAETYDQLADHHTPAANKPAS
jgi:hypothetical protein